MIYLRIIIIIKSLYFHFQPSLLFSAVTSAAAPALPSTTRLVPASSSNRGSAEMGTTAPSGTTRATTPDNSSTSLRYPAVQRHTTTRRIPMIPENNFIQYQFFYAVSSICRNVGMQRRTENRNTSKPLCTYVLRQTAVISIRDLIFRQYTFT